MEGVACVSGHLHLSSCATGAGPMWGLKVELSQGAAGEEGKDEKLSRGWAECDSPENLSSHMLTKAINNFY